MAAPVIIAGGILVRLAAKKILKEYLKKQSKQTLKRLGKRGGRICKSCKQKVKCFSRKNKGTDEELDRQLEMQEAAVNNMTPDELETALKNFKSRPNDAAARASERTKASEELSEALDRELQKSGMNNVLERRRAVKSEVDRMMRGMDALHTLDWAGGGDGSMSGVGPRSDNRLVGGGWSRPQNTPGGGKTTRRQQLLEMAQDAKKDGAEKMNVKLQRCKPGV